MKKMLKIVALLSVMIGNFAIIQSSAHAITSGYWQSTPSLMVGTLIDTTTVHMSYYKSIA